MPKKAKKTKEKDKVIRVAKVVPKITNATGPSARTWTVQVETRMAIPEREYRIEYSVREENKGDPQKISHEVAIVRETNEVRALQWFVNVRCPTITIQKVSQVPDIDALQSEIDELKAKLAECQSRKNAKANKKA